MIESAHIPMTSLSELQSLYDQNRFLDAFRETASYWRSSQSLSRAYLRSIDFRRSDWPLLPGWPAAIPQTFSPRSRENTTDAHVSLFHGRDCRDVGGRLFDQLRSWKANPKLPGADAITQANWLASQAVTWASLRDFARAHDCIQHAEALTGSQRELGGLRFAKRMYLDSKTVGMKPCGLPNSHGRFVRALPMPRNPWPEPAERRSNPRGSRAPCRGS